jgi:hypothetical protein
MIPVRIRRSGKAFLWEVELMRIPAERWASGRIRGADQTPDRILAGDFEE